MPTVPRGGLGSVLTGLSVYRLGAESRGRSVCFQVGSRITWQVCAVMLVVIGVIEKFATALTLIPDPVLGAMVLKSHVPDS